MSETLEQAIADEREDAAVLRKLGHAKEADVREKIIDRLAAAAVDFTTWYREREAMLWSGKGVDWFRARRGAWERDGHARRSEHNHRVWEYRRCVLPRGAAIDAARADAERAAAAAVSNDPASRVA